MDKLPDGILKGDEKFVLEVVRRVQARFPGLGVNIIFPEGREPGGIGFSVPEGVSREEVVAALEEEWDRLAGEVGKFVIDD